jgi:arylsulfatase A-like enzyme
MRLRIVVVAALALGVSRLSGDLIAQRGSASGSRPNVVLVIMDDLGYGDIGSYGVPDAKTPHLDRLAREGVRLTQAYANGPVCSPTRAALISGRYQQRVGIEWALTSTADPDRGLPVTGTSLPALLKKNRYATGLVGKWHLGFRPELGPNAHGFDEFFGFMGGAVDYYTHRRGDGTPDLYENTTPVENAGYLTDEITKRAASFIDRHTAGPFFLEVAYNAVHWPFQPPDLPASDPRRNDARDRRFAQMPDDPVPATRLDYVRMLERADQGVGTILAALDRNRVAQNTLVIFTNDNGGHGNHPAGRLPGGWRGHPAGSGRPGAARRASALLAHRPRRAAPEGGAGRALEDAGRWRTVPPLRSERRSRRAARSRGAAHGHRREAQGDAGPVGERCRSPDAEPMN